MFPGGQAHALVRGAPRPLRTAVWAGRNWLNRNQLVAKALPTGFGFAFGDLLTQLGQHSRSPAHLEGQPFNWQLTKAAAMAAIGLTVAGPIGLHFLRWAEVAILPGTAVGSAVRFTLDQVLGCLIWQAAYLSMCATYRADALWLWNNCIVANQQGTAPVAAAELA